VAKLIVVTREGNEEELSSDDGRTVMEIIRDCGVDELLAVCGGCSSCATCHVYVDQRFNAQMPAMSEDENNLLDASSHRTKESRLSCQIAFRDVLDGLRVTIAPED
jgi:2Fe-2S ferredoxin